jgi:DNA end-binding protein Ku
MARRPIWRGSLSFGLVQIPVGLYSAEQSHQLDLDMLDRRDMAHIGYQKINKNTGKPVERDAIVKGYQYKKGEYVIVEEDELRAAAQARSETIDIIGFVDKVDIAPLYYEKPYYLAPTGKTAKAYVLLRQVLLDTGKAGVATMVLRTKQHVGVLFVHGPALVLDYLRYADEVRDPAELEIPEKATVTKKELDLARQLVSGLEMRWDPTQFEDTYHDQLVALIEKKAKTGKLEPVTSPRPTAAAEGASIVELLRESMRAGAANVDQEKRQKPRRRAAGGRRRR